MKRISGLLLIFTVVATLTACVTARQYDEVLTKKAQFEDENLQLAIDNDTLTKQNLDLNAKSLKMSRLISKLKMDTTELGFQFRRISRTYDQLNQTYDLLLQKNRELLRGNELETQKILLELQAAQERLLKKEDSLQHLELEYQTKMIRMQKLSDELKVAQQAMALREAKISELEKVIAMKENELKSLKEIVSKALVGFEGKGINVEQKDGKIYVSMENKLLFSSGSFSVNKEGQKALVELAKALENNKDISIIIEGHTDNVSYKGAGNISDNWDLSVKRATSIVKILIANSKIDPAQLTASGRSKFHPIDNEDTPEARAKNRRTEIILSPNLNELINVIK